MRPSHAFAVSRVTWSCARCSWRTAAAWCTWRATRATRSRWCSSRRASRLALGHYLFSIPAVSLVARCSSWLYSVEVSALTCLADEECWLGGASVGLERGEAWGAGRSQSAAPHRDQVAPPRDPVSRAAHPISIHCALQLLGFLNYEPVWHMFDLRLHTTNALLSLLVSALPRSSSCRVFPSGVSLAETAWCVSRSWSSASSRSTALLPAYARCSPTWSHSLRRKSRWTYSYCTIKPIVTTDPRDHWSSQSQAPKL